MIQPLDITPLYDGEILRFGSYKGNYLLHYYMQYQYPRGAACIVRISSLSEAIQHLLNKYV